MAKTRTVRAFSAGGVVFRLPPMSGRMSGRVSGHVSGAATGPAPTAPTALTESPLDGAEIALVGRTRPNIWVLPKGTPRRGERVPETALREVREETGLITTIVGELGSIHYSFSRDHTRYHKEVFHFLMEAVGGDVSLHDAEYDEARWFPAREAAERLTFPNDAGMVRRALPLIAKMRLDAGSGDANTRPSVATSAVAPGTTSGAPLEADGTAG